ncbi:electron transport protein, partial [Bacillus paralicheniformis]|nr:electron transport protein [Bacillus paralicheniformis]
DTPVPLLRKPKILKVPTAGFDPEQIKLSWAQGDSEGGYKVPSLIGVYWRAPYLHDGGVAVGSSLKETGIPNTVIKGKQADPYNSLLAMIDRDLRQQVVTSNSESPDLKAVRVTGKGHEFWIDAKSGFSEQEQKALIHYLIHTDMPKK